VLRIQVSGRRELLTVVGNVASISAGEEIRAVGEWNNDLMHGLQFKATSLQPSPDQPRSIERLSRVGNDPGNRPAFSPNGSVATFGARVFGRDRRAAAQAEKRGRESVLAARPRLSRHGRAEDSSATSWCSLCERRGHFARGPDLQTYGADSICADHREPVPAGAPTSAASAS